MMNRKNIIFSLLLTSTLFAENSSYAVLEGPESITNQLEFQRTKVEKRKPILDGYYKWKEEVKDETGVSFGAQVIMLYQQASNTLAGEENNGASAIYRLNGTYTAFEHEDGHIGRIAMRIENRSGLGSLQSPASLSSAIGIHSLTSGFAYSDTFDTDLSIFNWTQGIKDRYGFAIGRLAFDAYLDAFAFQTFTRAFINRSFVLNPTLATTGIGALGIVAKGFVTDNILIGAQLYDANAISGDFDMDTIQENEWLKAVEVAWTPDINQFKTNRIQFTYWHKDARSLVNIGSGNGWAVSASGQFTKNLLSFVRFGHSNGDGGVSTKNALSTGFEYTLMKDHAWSLGAGWAEPKQPNTTVKLQDEYVFETSYRMQVSPSISITPDLQYLIDPAKNPTEKSIWIAGIRFVLTL